MIAKTLVLVCAAFGLVAGNYFDCAPETFSQRGGSFGGCFSQASAPAPVTFATSAPAPVTFATSAPISENIFTVAAPAPIAPLSGVSCEASFPAELLGGVSGGFGQFASAGATATASNGPESAALPLIQAPAVTLPAVEGPVVTLSSPAIPAPRVLSQKCICTKTIVKPQVYERTVVVPKVQRYLKRTVTPVVENVAYKSTPIAQPEAASASVSVAAPSQVYSIQGSSQTCGTPVYASPVQGSNKYC